MLKNHLKIAFRQIKKQKFYSAVNIIGLAIGVACCLLIALFVQDELSYDQQHPNVENLYRIGLDVNWNEWEAKSLATPPILAPTLLNEIPEITQVARTNPHFFNAGSNIVKKRTAQEGLYEEGFVYVDPSYFDLFHLPLIYGDKNEILAQPFSIVITESIAKKYFGNKNPVGEIFILNDDEKDQSYKITGVTEDLPEQMHFDYDFFMSINTLDETESTNWIFNNYYTYITLAEGAKPSDLKEKLSAFTYKNFGPQFKKDMNTDLREMESKGERYHLFLQPVADIHLHSEGYTQFLKPQGDIQHIQLFGVIALFILLIALVNFVNLSTARSANRAKEVGLRKVLGSYQKQLVTQFLTESVLMSVVAFALGIGFAFFLLPLFGELSGKELSIPFGEIGFIFLMFGSAISIGILAGLYPSFYLSAFQPVKVLKGKLSLGSKSGWMRSGLVVFQFAISIGLIVATMVVFNQMNFIQNKKLGFEKDQILLLQDTYTLGDKMPAFKEALKKLPEVKNVTRTSYVPLDGGKRNSVAFNKRDKNSGDEKLLIQTWYVDEDYINTLGMELREGRTFNLEMPTDDMGVILNETAAREFGILNDPIGKLISSPFRTGDYNVIGVVKDFNYDSLKGKVRPLGLFLGNSASVVSIKTTAAEMESLITKAESVWKTFAPGQPYRYDFLDDRFAKMYKTEDRVGKLFGIFSVLAIFIACLGLLALATFMTEQRMKEIGIRKVLGASVPNIVFTLSKSFLIYVIIGLLIATPIAWIKMGEWLNNFEYRISLEWWMFAFAGLMAIVIAFLTVGSKSLVAALTNPVDSLKNE